MAATTYADFNAATEALDVAKAFSDNVYGKTILITGVNKDGIGFSTAQAFASQYPAHLILTGRSLSKIQECVHALEFQFPGIDCRGLQIDLSSQQSVREAADRLMAWTDIPSIEIVINNARIMGIKERTLSCDGIELHFATNHIGHWLFTCLMFDHAKAHQLRRDSSRRYHADRQRDFSFTYCIRDALGLPELQYEKQRSPKRRATAVSVDRGLGLYGCGESIL
ncbi:hypothetical protein N7488_006437 [Penicillium malachiteum]|nr:hypothetical protein N7488_006437 [Penicillium malachiteum]